MEKKDRGWDYLNSSGDNFDYDKENDGSWGYENDDGSGSFYGADGSWGYKNSDGSASYYGADGSWGYKNSDGSASYYGADGSWGYKNSDGSGSYYGSDNESEYYDSDDEDDDDSEYSSGDGDISGGAAVVSALLGLGLAAFAIGKSKRNQSDYDYDSDDEDEEEDDDDEDYYDEEYIRQQQELEEKRREEAARQAELEQAKKDKRKARFKRVWSAIAHKKMIEVNITSAECIGQNYLKVIALFEKSGFSKIHTNIIEDLEYYEISRENLVTDVTVAGNNYFDMMSQAKYDSDVVITFHKPKRVAPPMSHKDAKKMPGKDVVTVFENAGFVDVKENVIRDLTFGWLKKDGAVDSVTVAGESRYRMDSSYRVDTPILVTYHTFKNK